ncbi:MAG: hypothetical protein M0Z34_08550 [Nitrospiraceae bacterium]|nr:hypothetical protein [Nitrospiraceae bacterium]
MAWVTSELTAPGVHFGSGRIVEPDPRVRHGLEPDLIGTVVVVTRMVGMVEEGGAAVAAVDGDPADVGPAALDTAGAPLPEFAPGTWPNSVGTSSRTKSRPTQVNSCALPDIARKRRHAPGRPDLVILHPEVRANLS